MENYKMYCPDHMRERVIVVIKKSDRFITKWDARERFVFLHASGGVSGTSCYEAYEEFNYPEIAVHEFLELGVKTNGLTDVAQECEKCGVATFNGVLCEKCGLTHEQVFDLWFEITDNRIGKEHNKQWCKCVNYSGGGYYFIFRAGGMYRDEIFIEEKIIKMTTLNSLQKLPHAKYPPKS